MPVWQNRFFDSKKVKRQKSKADYGFFFVILHPIYFNKVKTDNKRYEFNQDFDKVVRQQVVTRHETDSATGREGKGRLSRDSAARQRSVTPAHQGQPAEGTAVS
jgi:hypothetical protein